MRVSIATLIRVLLILLAGWTLVAAYFTQEFFEFAAVSLILYGSTYVMLEKAVSHDLLLLKGYLIYIIHWKLIAVPIMISYPGFSPYLSDSPPDHETLLRSFIYLSMYHVVAGTIVLACDRSLKLKFAFRRLPRSVRLVKTVCGYIAVASAFALICYYYRTDHGIPAHLVMFLGWEFLPAFLSILVVVQYRTLSFPNKALVLGTVAMFLLARALGGSKGAIHMLAIPAIITLWVIRRNHRFQITATRAVIAVVLSVIGLYSYHYGARFRQLATGGETIQLADLPEFLQRYPIQVEQTLTDVLSRLTELDGFVLVVTTDDSRLGKQMSLGTTVQSAVNLLVPGTPFRASKRVGQLYRADYYRGYDQNQIEAEYHTDVFGVFTVCIALTNRLGGLGLVVALLLADMALIGFAVKRASPRFRSYLILFAPYHIYAFFYMMAPDEFLAYHVMAVVCQSSICFAVLALMTPRKVTGLWLAPSASRGLTVPTHRTTRISGGLLGRTIE